jgi:hypothetical protein
MLGTGSTGVSLVYASKFSIYADDYIDKGRIWGSTFTLPASQGAFLIAFLAIYIRWTGGHLWNIICFLVHQHRSNPDPQDGLFHQQQALLRNAVVDTDTIWHATRLGYAWRRHTKSPIRRSSALVLLAALNWASFGVAGIFSSRVAVTRDAVLLRPGTCGYSMTPMSANLMSTKPEILPKSINAMYVFGRWTAKKAIAYVSSCYDDEAMNTNDSMCQTYARRKIKSGRSRNVTCPFPNNLCDAVVEMDSGYIDSNRHLGINSPPKDRIQFRKVSTCAVIPAEEKFATNWTTTTPSERQVWDIVANDAYRYYNLGPLTPTKSYFWAQTKSLANYTFVRSNTSSWSQKMGYDLGFVKDLILGFPIPSY